MRRQPVRAPWASAFALALFLPPAPAAAELLTQDGDGLVIYGVSGDATPQTRHYLNSISSFGVALPAIAGAAGDLFALAFSSATSKREAVAVYSDASTLYVLCYDGASDAWTAEWTDTRGGGASMRAFDVAYESASGDVIVLYSSGSSSTNELVYRTKPGASGCGSANWSARTYLDPARTSGVVNWVKLAQDPRSASNIIAAIWSDSNSDLSAMVWDGAAWENEPGAALETSLEVVAAAGDVEDFDVAVESLSGDIMVVWANSAGANGTNGVRYASATYTGGNPDHSWSGVVTPPTWLDDATELDISANPLSNEIVFASVGNAGADLQVGYWSGTAWTNTANHDTACEPPLAYGRRVATGWLNAGGTARSVVAYQDSNATNIGWSVGNGATFTLQTDSAPTPAFVDPQYVYRIAVDPINRDRLVLVASDNGLDLFGKRLSMTSAPAFSWSNAYGNAKLNDALETADAFAFGFWPTRPTATLKQSSHRLFANTDTTDVGSPLASQDAPAQLASAGAAFRLRMLLHVGNGNLAQNGAGLRLQYVDPGLGTCAAPSGGTPAAYTDVTAATLIAFNNNTPADAASLTVNGSDPVHSGHSTDPQTYEELNASTNSVSAVSAGRDGMWDFALKDNGAPAGTAYCLRLVRSDGSLLDGYETYPDIATAGPCRVQRTVCASGCGYTTIQAAVNSLPPAPSYHSCVLIQDAGSYAEQVTVQNFNTAVASITIRRDPENGAHPTVVPPAGSTAAFVVANASVNISNIDIRPGVSLSYGIRASSRSVTISSVNVDSGGYLQQAAISLSSDSVVSRSSVTVQAARGIWVIGGSTGSSINFSTAASSGGYAVYFETGSYANTFSRGYASNTSGEAVYLEGDSTTVEYSTVSRNSSGEAFYVGGAANVVRYSHVSNPSGDGVRLNAGFNALSSCYLDAPSGKGLNVSGGSFNSLSQSTVTGGGGAANAAVYLSGGEKHAIAQSRITGSSGADGVSLRTSSNTVTLSTITVTGGGRGVSMIGASSHTLSSSYVQSASTGVYALGAAYTTISQVTVAVTGGGSGVSAVALSGSSYTLLTQSFVSNADGGGMGVGEGASSSTVQLSTVSGGGRGLFFAGAALNRVTGSYIEATGLPGLEILGSTDSAVSANTLVGDEGLRFGLGSSGLALSLNTVIGEGAYGVRLDSNNSGLLILSTNTLRHGSGSALFVATQAAGTELWITSNTIVLSPGAGGNAFGIQVDGLAGGATIQNNGVVLRAPGSMGAWSAYGLRLKSAAGVRVERNRLSQPGMLTAGSYEALSLSDADNTEVFFNDVYSTGAGFTNHYLLRAADGSTGLKVRNNIFFSSAAVTGSSATLSVAADSQSGFSSDYNDFFSSNSANAALWGATRCGLPAWSGAGCPAQDANSIAADPWWQNPGAGGEDFHPRSSGGRYDPATQAFVLDGVLSATLDAGDPAEAFSQETAGNGGRVNQGSYGNTAEASRSEVAGGGPPCVVTRTVCAAACGYTTIQAALDSIPAALTANTCVLIQDAGTYTQQVTVQNFTGDWTLSIKRDPAGAARPTMNPPASSTAAFIVRNDGIIIDGIDIQPANAIPYGILAASSNITISSMIIRDAAGKIGEAAIWMSSWTKVSHTSATLGGATTHGFVVTGSSNVISYSSASISGDSRNAVYFYGASYSTFTLSLGTSTSTTGSAAAVQFREADNNLISFSTITAAIRYGFYCASGSSNTVTNSVIKADSTLNGVFLSGPCRYNSFLASSISSLASYGVSLAVGAHHNTFHQCVITGDDGGFTSNSSFTVISESIVTGNTGTGVTFNSGVPQPNGTGFNTVIYSTAVTNAPTLTSYGVNMEGVSNSVLNSYVYGRNAGIYVSASTDTVIGGSTIGASQTSAAGVQMTLGSVGLSLSSSVVTGGTAASGRAFSSDSTNGGLIVLSSNTLKSGEFVVRITTPAAGAEIWITSNTILPGFLTTSDTAGLLLIGLAGGATIQNNGIYFRKNASALNKYAFGLYGLVSPGLVIDHNRFSQPGVQTNGSSRMIYLSGSPNASITYNDVHSTSTASLLFAQLLEIDSNSTGVQVKNNIFSSSWPVASSGGSTSAIHVALNSQTGFVSDYNSWYSSNTKNSAVWGNSTPCSLPHWVGAGCPAQDANSISAPPLWRDPRPGTEDFHPLSQAGRYDPATQTFVADNVTSDTIDAADPAQSSSSETAPSLYANLGSYGNTGEASRAHPKLCPVQRNVCPLCAYGSIQNALASLPSTLTGASCVVLKEPRVYVGSATIEGFTMNGSSLTIRSDTGLSGRAVIQPLGSTAGFHIKNSSVNIIDLDIVPAAALSFGIQTSSANYVTLSSVNIQDAGGLITAAGVLLSSWSVVSHSSIVVKTAYGLWVTGSTNAVSYSSMTGKDISIPAEPPLIVDGSSNTFLGIYALGLPGIGGGPLAAQFRSGADRNTISSSTLIGSIGSLDIYGAGNRVESTDISETWGNTTTSLYVDPAASSTWVAASTVTCAASAYAVQWWGSGGTFTRGFVSGEYGGFEFNGSGNTISASTITSTGSGEGLRVRTALNVILNSTISGATATFISGGSSTTIGGSVLTASFATGSGLGVTGVSKVLSISSSVLRGGSQGTGLYVGDNVHYLSISSNTISGRNGIVIASQTTGTQIWLTSNTVLPSFDSSVNTYGIYLRGLGSGATVQNNSVFYRAPGGQGIFTAYGLYAKDAPGLVVERNRLNQPGLLTGGSLSMLYLQNSQNARIAFNDVHSSGTGLTAAYLLDFGPGSSGGQVRNNVFLSSMTVSGAGSSSATLRVDVASQGGFSSNYNDFYSSAALNTALYGTAPCGLPSWTGAGCPVGQDANSIAQHPLWKSLQAGFEDFHPLAAAGRYDPGTQTFVYDVVIAATIDAADPAEPYALETSPSGSRANQGSYGNTAEASRSGTVAPTVSAYGMGGPSGRVNQGKRAAVLRFTVTASASAVNVASVTVRMLDPDLNALSNAQAQNLFGALLLVADTLSDATTGQFFMNMDTQTVVAVGSNSFSLNGAGAQILGTPKPYPADSLVPAADTRQFLVVADWTANAAAQSPNAARFQIDADADIKVVDAATEAPYSLAASAELTTASFTAVAAPAPPAGWPRDVGSSTSAIEGGAVINDAANTMYAGSINGKLVALNNDGTIKWSFTTGSPIRTYPTVVAESGTDFVYVANDAGSVYKVRDDGTTGTQVWSRALTGVTNLKSAPVVQGATIYLAATDDKVYKLKSSNGDDAPGWSSDPGISGAFSSTIYLDDRSGINAFWAASEGGEIYRVQAGNGSVTTSTGATGIKITGTPNLDSGLSNPGDNSNYLFWGADDGWLRARTSANLTTVPEGWADFVTQPLGAIRSSPYINRDESPKGLYFGSDNSRLYKIRADTGAIVWSYATGGMVRSSPIVLLGAWTGAGADYVYFGSDDGHVYALKVTDGTMRPNWPVSVGGPVRTGPIYDFASGTIAVGSQDGRLVRIPVGP